MKILFHVIFLISFMPAIFSGNAAAEDKKEHDPTELINHGSAYVSEGQYDSAIIDLTKAIELNPKSAKAYGFRGSAYKKKGQLDKAISDFTKAIELNPNFIEIYYLLRGGAYMEKGQHYKGISDSTKAIEANPKFADAYLFRAHFYSKKLNDYKKACPDWKRACDLGLCEKYELAKSKRHCTEQHLTSSGSIDSKTSKSNIVRKVQLNLIRLGYNPGPADGIMGPRTRTAVKAFQRDNGLKVDGRVNEALFEQLVTAWSTN